MDIIPADADAWHDSLTRAFVLLLAISVLSTLVLADGGVLLLQKQVGSLEISVFGTPVPLRVGPADLSILLQNSIDQNMILDAQLTVTLSKKNQSNIMLQPTRAAATSKFLYAAQLTFPEQGSWHLHLQCKEKNRRAELDGELTVAPNEPPLLTYWLYFLLVPFAILLFVLNQSLKRARNIKSQRARP